jgi:MGT family glycosyltransferase
MSRFLFVMIDAGGNVPAQLSVARRLVARGHEVRVLGDPVLESAAQKIGAHFAPFRRAPLVNISSTAWSKEVDWEPRRKTDKLRRLGELIWFGPAEKYARDVLDEVERFRPDAIAVDQMVFGAIIGAEAASVPAVVLMHTVGGLRLEGVPPPGLGLRPATGPLGRLRDRALAGIMQRMFDRPGLPALNATRVALGLPPIDHVFDLYLRLDRALVLASRAFELPTGALPARVQYVGPQLDDPSWTELWSGVPQGNDPLVLVALGSTYQKQEQPLARVIEALGRMPVRGVVTLGGVFEPARFTPPSNVIVVRSAPHQQLLPEVRLAVVHGGHGTVMKALAHGVPLLCVPLGRDQPDIAVRVELAGAGLTLPPSAGVARIARAVGRLLNEPRFAEAARRMQRAIAEDMVADTAVAEMEELATAPRGAARAAPSTRSNDAGFSAAGAR